MLAWLSEIPLFWGKILAIAGFTAMIAWTWFRPRDYIYKGAVNQKRWRDLRIWTTLALGIQVVIYLVF